MLLSEAITNISYALRGIDDDAPTLGSDEYTYWLSILNKKKDELYRDPNVAWRSAFKETAPNEVGTVATTGTTTLTGTSTKFQDYRVGDKITVDGETVRTIATIASDTSLTVTVAFSNTDSALTFTHQSIIATGVQSYNLHRYFIGASDLAYVTDTNDIRHEFDIIPPEARSTTVQNVFISDENPEKVTFTSEIESTDSIVGGVLTVPAYYLPADLSAATDVLPFLDPNWAVMSVAAEIAFSDIVYENKAPDLLAAANNLYLNMASRNRKGTYDNPRTVPYSVPRLGERRN